MNLQDNIDRFNRELTSLKQALTTTAEELVTKDIQAASQLRDIKR